MKPLCLSLVFALTLISFIGTTGNAEVSTQAQKYDKVRRIFGSVEEGRKWRDGIKRAASGDLVDSIPSVESSHPRLMFRREDWAKLKNRCNVEPGPARILESLKAKANAMLKEDPPALVPSVDGNYLEVSREALKRISTFAGLYVLCGDRRYLVQAKKDLLLNARRETWNPEHFLDVAEMTVAQSLGYDWLYDELSEAERKTISESIKQKGLLPGIDEYSSTRWWTYSPFNWNLVCNGGMVLGALVIADDDSVLADRVLSCAKRSVPFAMRFFAPDGGWAEGPGYWCYATKYAMLMIASLDSSIGTDFGWKTSPGFSKTGFFRIYTTAPSGEYFNFADSAAKERRAPQMFWLSSVFGEPHFAEAELAVSKRQNDIFHLLFYPLVIGEDIEDLPRETIFEGVNVGSYRSSWTDPDALYLGFKGGCNEVNHANLDLGTFILEWKGRRWAAELGPDNYALPGYFGDKRWTYYRLGTVGQNTLTIDGSNQLVSANARVEKIVRDGEKFRARVDLTEAYGDKVASIERTFLVAHDADGDYFRLKDVIRKLKAKELTWHLHTMQSARLAPDAKAVILVSKEAPRRKLELRLITPESAKFRIVPVSLKPPQEPTDGVTDIQVVLSKPTPDVDITVEFR